MLEYLSGGILPGIAALSGLPADDEEKESQSPVSMPCPPKK